MEERAKKTLRMADRAAAEGDEVLAAKETKRAADYENEANALFNEMLRMNQAFIVNVFRNANPAGMTVIADVR
ncbi:hypothetical protein QEG98_41990 (plasmid) [Myxococcus sp. MxC21-1]|uniref:hypothetical protein n=1 Tax=Myxococcus sp. MxC21-1 TaxID=3041439 RepID=UPI00292D0396|nr:hypothetical protein [Myxococcus sp. MxC21-1]WNZ66240.1 hypothetical protein QEG98_41990 [Myxococcus sp. MxC21-1]